MLIVDAADHVRRRCSSPDSCVGMAPAAIRNAVVARQFSFVSSHGGLNFYIGNSERATGLLHHRPGDHADDRRTGEGHAPRRGARARAPGDRRRGVGLLLRPRVGVDGRSIPATPSALFARKFYYVFNAQHVALPHSYPFYALRRGHGAALLRDRAVAPDPAGARRACCSRRARGRDRRDVSRLGRRSSPRTRRRSRSSSSPSATACRCSSPCASAPAPRSTPGVRSANRQLAGVRSANRRSRCQVAEESRWRIGGELAPLRRLQT